MIKRLAGSRRGVVTTIFGVGIVLLMAGVTTVLHVGRIASERQQMRADAAAGAAAGARTAGATDSQVWATAAEVYVAKLTGVDPGRLTPVAPVYDALHFPGRQVGACYRVGRDLIAVRHPFQSEETNRLGLDPEDVVEVEASRPGGLRLARVVGRPSVLAVAAAAATDARRRVCSVPVDGRRVARAAASRAASMRLAEAAGSETTSAAAPWVASGQVSTQQTGPVNLLLLDARTAASRREGRKVAKAAGKSAQAGRKASARKTVAPVMARQSTTKMSGRPSKKAKVLVDPRRAARMPKKATSARAEAHKRAPARAAKAKTRAAAASGRTAGGQKLPVGVKWGESVPLSKHIHTGTTVVAPRRRSGSSRTDVRAGAGSSARPLALADSADASLSVPNKRQRAGCRPGSAL